jgi:hypothetical protein
LERIVQSDSALINYAVEMENLWEQAIFSAPKISPILSLLYKTKSDAAMKCLSEMSKKINNGFDDDKWESKWRLKSQIFTTSDELSKGDKKDRLIKSFYKYKEGVWLKISDFVVDIKVATDPRTATKELFEKLNTTCNDIKDGFPKIAANFTMYLKCNSIFGCLPVDIKNAYDAQNENNERTRYFRYFVFDSIYMTQIATYCAGIRYNEKNIDGMKEFVGDIKKDISEGLESAEKIIMEREIMKMKQIESDFRDRFLKLNESVKPVIKNPDFWIENVKKSKLIYLCLMSNIPDSLIFADEASSFHIFNCPKTDCFFIENFLGMHIMYSRTYGKKFESYNEPLDLIDDFYVDFGEVNHMVNKSNPNFTAIVEEFNRLNPFRYSLNDFYAAAMFFHPNQAEFKLGFQGFAVQPYVHRNIQASGGTIKFFAPTNKFFYNSPADWTCNSNMIMV